MAWVLQSLLSLPVGAFVSAQFDGDLVSNNVNSLIFIACVISGIKLTAVILR